MQINISRLKSYQQCPQKAFQTYHEMRSTSKSMNLVDGSAFHKGVAVGQATGDWGQALVEARETFDANTSHMDLLEQMSNTMHWDVVEACVEKYRECWQDEGMQIVQPECEFEVPLAGTEHNDITVHWIDFDHLSGEWKEMWGMPPAEAIREGRVCSPHKTPAEDCACWRPHMLLGRTDGIIAWKERLWLQEHKTTSTWGELFWRQWNIDQQVTGYMYGVGKATGLEIAGVVLNALYKPSESQVRQWNPETKKGPVKTMKDYVKFERQFFLRSAEDLRRFEKETGWWLDRWEASIVSGQFPMAPISHHCFAYNRECDFYQMCLNHGDPAVGESYYEREPDYVDEARKQVLVQICQTQ